MRLQNKVAIITGAGRGIGATTALKFAKEGAKIVVADINIEDIRKRVDEIKDLGTEAIGIKVDVTNRLEVDQMIKKTMEAFGTIDILINNAGITQDARLVKMTEEQFDKVVDVNLKGTFNCAQAVSPIMTTQGKGAIINASSVVGIYGNFGQTNYAATKFGVIGMTKTWCKELSPKGIRVNAVAPGFILTPMTEKMPQKVLDMMAEKAPMKRLGTPEDIANAYVFLASDEASFISGAVLEVTGGIIL
ncbi:3-oxoacyl-ACP reductase FabG [Lutibacter sp. B2]|nr:3-oxoacyl-ACP reductase FabG [Lutibacter sp. B2]